MNLMVPIFWIRIFWLKFNLRFFIFHWVLRVKLASDSFNPHQGFFKFSSLFIEQICQNFKCLLLSRKFKAREPEPLSGECWVASLNSVLSEGKFFIFIPLMTIYLFGCITNFSGDTLQSVNDVEARNPLKTQYQINRLSVLDTQRAEAGCYCKKKIRWKTLQIQKI